jgi:hypothetical protein
MNAHGGDMRIRPVFVIIATGVAALALASVKTTWSVVGQGGATNSAGVNAHFGVHAFKVHHQGLTRTEGRLVLETFTSKAPGPKVKMSVRELVVEENMGTMAGPAVLFVPHGTGHHEFHGHAHARAISNRHPGETGDPDVILVRFTRDGGPNFEYEGRVVHGDITVGKSVTY